MLTRRFLTVKEVAELLQVSEASVRHWIKQQQLRAIDLGREWRVIPRDLEAFVATHSTCRSERLPADAAGASHPVAATGGETPSNPANGLSRPHGQAGGHAPDVPHGGANFSKEK